jgi:hypothetical protein
MWDNGDFFKRDDRPIPSKAKPKRKPPLAAHDRRVGKKAWNARQGPSKIDDTRYVLHRAVMDEEADQN